MISTLINRVVVFLNNYNLLLFFLIRFRLADSSILTWAKLKVIFSVMFYIVVCGMASMRKDIAAELARSGMSVAFSESEHIGPESTKAREKSGLAHRLRHVLVDKDWVAVGVDEREVRRTVGGLVGLGLELDAALLQDALEFAHVLEVLRGLPLVIPARIEGQAVPFEHALEQTDLGGAVLEDDPVLLELAGHLLEVECLVKGLRGLDVLHVEADGEVSELHGVSLLGLLVLRKVGVYLRHLNNILLLLDRDNMMVLRSLLMVDVRRNHLIMMMSI